VTDGDVVVAEQDLADDEADDLLALLDRERFSVGRQPSAERVERLRELEVGLGIAQFGIESIELGAERCFASAQLRHAGAELLERDQLFLVAVD
jgi:hypothetical protein